MPTAKKAKTASTSAAKKAAKPSSKKQPSASKTAKPKTPKTASMDWSATIKKAAQSKRSQASWPGTGDAWKKKSRV